MSVALMSSMEKILERYERYSYAERRLVANDNQSNVHTKLFPLYYKLLCIYILISYINIMKTLCVGTCF